MNFKKVVDAWHNAAIDLKLKIQSPVILKTHDSQEINFELLIEDFGTSLGTIVFSIDNYNSDDFSLAKQADYYCSAVNPDSYSVYERQHFIDTLNDWQYFGKESEKPDWYTGQSWA